MVSLAKVESYLAVLSDVSFQLDNRLFVSETVLVGLDALPVAVEEVEFGGV